MHILESEKAKEFFSKAGLTVSKESSFRSIKLVNSDNEYLHLFADIQPDTLVIIDEYSMDISATFPVLEIPGIFVEDLT